MTWLRRLFSSPSARSSSTSRRRFMVGSRALAGETARTDHAEARPLASALRDGEPWVGEIVMFAGNFAPRGWAFCDGQLLSPTEYDALFSLLGTTYGGDGRTTFALPDLRGRVPIHSGGAPTPARRLGTQSGQESLPVPAHTHDLPEVLVRGTGTQEVGATGGADLGVPASTETAGTNDGNMQPFLAINFIIALNGIYPPRY